MSDPDPDDGFPLETVASQAATSPTLPASTESAPARPSSPNQRYVLGDEIARGGMGRVVMAMDTRLGRQVAIKEALGRTATGGGELARRFEREVRITARLEHPSIVPLYDAGVTDAGQPFYVMRKVSGRPLERMIAETPSLDERLMLLPNVLTVAQAVAHAHRRGILHRDIKPSNILVGDLGETVLIDWGLAKVVGESSDDPQPRAPTDPVDPDLAPSAAVETMHGSIFGTPGFMAPEQARGESLDPRTDVYALGSTLYHLISGRPPLHGGSASEEIDRAKSEQPEDLDIAALPVQPELIAILKKARAFAPRDRYPDAAALADDLNRFLAGRMVAAHRYTSAERIKKLLRRHRTIASVIAIAVIVVAVIASLGIRGILREGDRARTAELDARQQLAEANAARDQATDRAAEALIARARAELVANPTAALATLRDLPPTSRRWLEARSVIAEARLRGVARLYPADDRVITLEIGPDRRSLLAVGFAGNVNVLDLERHTQRRLIAIKSPAFGAWGRGGSAVWLAPYGGGLFEVDAATGTRSADVIPDTVNKLRADPSATYLAFATSSKRFGIVDKTGVRFLDLKIKVEEFELAPDGSWIAVAGKDGLAIIDPAGVERFRAPGPFLPFSIAVKPGTAGVLVDKRTALELDLTKAQVATRKVEIGWDAGKLLFYGGRLFANMRSVVDYRAIEEQDLSIRSVAWSRPAWGGYAAVSGDRLRLLRSGRTHELRSPIPTGMSLVAAREDSPYVAVSGLGAVVVWDLEPLLPQRLVPQVTGADFFDATTAIVHDAFAISWLDLGSSVRTRIETPPNRPTFVERMNPRTGRMLVVVVEGNRASRYFLVRRGAAKAEHVDADNQRIDFAGSDLVTGSETGEVRVLADGAPPRVVYRFGKRVDVVLGNERFLLAAAGTEVIRIELATGELVRGTFPDRYKHVVLTPNGDAWIAEGSDLLLWQGGQARLVTKLPNGVNRMALRGDTAVVSTLQRDVYTVDMQGHITRLLLRATHMPQFDFTTRFAIATTLEQATVIDLAHGTRMQVPHGRMLSIAPDGSRALYMDGADLMVQRFEVSDDPGRLRAMIERATNYTPDESALAGSAP